MRLSHFFFFLSVCSMISNSYADETTNEKPTEQSPADWDFACVPVKEFAKTEGGQDEIRFNNFLVKEGAVSSETGLSVSTLEIGFSVTNRTANNVYWSAEFLGFTPKHLPTFAASAHSPFRHTGPNQIETVFTRIMVPNGTLSRTEMICLRINSN
ncbi:hypothetical protein [Brucella intermedia]|uniref:hypothetical protein n=1 Tax=Brucella intermedia TaxID=94625 RepID=UPI002360453C|nr:hypothetical protein [Brucella intermedia]